MVNIIVFRNVCNLIDNSFIFLNKFLESRLPALHTFENIIFTKGSSALYFLIFVLEFDNFMKVLKIKGINFLISVLFFNDFEEVLRF